MSIVVASDTIESKNETDTLLKKTVEDFVSSEIVDVFNNIVPQTRETFSKHDITVLFNKRESLMRDLMKIRKSLSSHDEYLRRMKKIDETYPVYKDIISASRREVIAKYWYTIDPLLKQSYLDKMWTDIQQWWANAQGVFLLWDTNLVAVMKGEWSYTHELPQRTLTRDLNIVNVPKVIDVFVHEWKTYKIMEKSPGIQLDRLSSEQLAAIPQEHYDQYLDHVTIIEKAWLKLDPSKSSNFFYDEKIGFCFIDLWVAEENNTWSMFDRIGNFNPSLYLDAKKLQSAWDKRI